MFFLKVLKKINALITSIVENAENNAKALNIKIFIAYHKTTPVLNTDIFTPIHVGRALNSTKLDMIGDDTGDNISIRNPNYSELTALYWMWKNENADYVGLCHYSRIFDFNPKNAMFDERFFSFPDTFTESYNLSEKFRERFGWNNESVQKLCKEYDVIVPPLAYLIDRISIYDHYKKNHNEKDLITAIEVIKEKYPEYNDIINMVMVRQCGYFLNMCLMKKEVFDDYAKWLFDILFEVEKRIDISSYDPYQSRVFGFISERLNTVYIEKLKQEGKYSIKELFLIERKF